MSFRGRGLPEESAFFLGSAKKQIPRFARDDIKLLCSAACKAGLILDTLRHGRSRALQGFESCHTNFEACATRIASTNLRPAETGVEMIVHHAGGLHERVAYGRPDKTEAALF